MGEMNYADIRINTEVLDQTGGAAELTVTAEVSNDAQNFSPFTALSPAAPITTTGITPVTNTAGFAFIRFKIQLALTGTTGGEIGWVTFDLHANFTKM